MSHKPSSGLPFPTERVLVRCPRYRCVAFRDRQGLWRNYYSRDLIEGPVEIVEMLSETSPNGSANQAAQIA